MATVRATTSSSSAAAATTQTGTSASAAAGSPPAATATAPLSSSSKFGFLRSSSMDKPAASAAARPKKEGHKKKKKTTAATKQQQQLHQHSTASSDSSSEPIPSSSSSSSSMPASGIVPSSSSSSSSSPVVSSSGLPSGRSMQLMMMEGSAPGSLRSLLATEEGEQLGELYPEIHRLVEELKWKMDTTLYNLHKQHKLLETQHPKVVSFEDPVKLNVGGVKYETSLSLLQKFPHSMLGCMFSGRWEMQKGKDGFFFVDRDGTLFRHILNYLRNGCVVGTDGNPSLREELFLEAKYFQLSDMVDQLRGKKPERILLAGKLNHKDFEKEWTKGRGQWSITEGFDDDRSSEIEEESSSERDSEREDSGDRLGRTRKREAKTKRDKEEREYLLFQSATARNAMEIIVGNPEWSDYIVEADLRNVGNRSWGHPGVIFHAQDVNNYEVIYFRPHSFHSGIQHGFKADQVVMSTSSAATVPHDNWFHVKVVVCSSEGFGRVYIDDMKKPSLVFALKFNNGCVGFFQYEQKGYFKNLVVKALDVEKEEDD